MSDDEKTYVVNLIKDKSVSFDFEDSILEEGNINHLSLILTTFKLAKYCQTNGKVNEFKKYIDQNKKKFQNFTNFIIINPLLKEIYQYAYKNYVLERRDNKERYQKITEYVENQLIKNKCMEEIKFLVSKGFKLQWCHDLQIMKTFDKNMIDNLIRFPELRMNSLLCDLQESLSIFERYDWRN